MKKLITLLLPLLMVCCQPANADLYSSLGGDNYEVRRFHKSDVAFTQVIIKDGSIVCIKTYIDRSYRAALTLVSTKCFKKGD